MTSYRVLRETNNGASYLVRPKDGGVSGTVPKPEVSGLAFSVDEAISTDQGTATKAGTVWQLSQSVTFDSDMGPFEQPGTVEYTARELGLIEWAPRHNPSEPKKVQLAPGKVATYNEDGPTNVEGGLTSSFTCEDRTWTLGDIRSGDRAPFIRAKADYDWTQRTPYPPKALHTPSEQYKGASQVRLNRTSPPETYFGPPLAFKQPDGSYLEKSSRFTWLTGSWTEDELELHDRPAAEEQEVGGAAWGSASVTWTDDVPDTLSDVAGPASGAVGAKQRLRIVVPDVLAQLTLGEAYRNQDAQGFAYAGFGVQTDGHIFLNAKKNAADSTVTIQGKGDIIVQSELGKLWAGASGDANIASQKNSFLMGGGGVVIAGGAAVTWGSNQDSDGTSPPKPAWMSGFGQAGSGINQVWAATDALVAVATGIKGVIAVKTGKPKGLDLGIALTNLVLGNLGGAIVSGLGARNADPIGGTVIHGTGGVIMGSTHTMGLYSLTGTTIASALGAGILAPSVGITGFNDATLESARTAEVKSGGTANVIGHQELLLASRTGVAKLLGKTIEIGMQVGVPPQSSNDKITMESNHVVVSVQGGAMGDNWYSANPMGIQLLSKTWIYNDSNVFVSRQKEDVHLAVQDKFGLAIRPDKLSLGRIAGRMKGVGGGSGVTITEPRVEIKADSTISFVVGSMEAKLDSSSFTTPCGTFDSSGVKLKGQIRLGG